MLRFAQIILVFISFGAGGYGLGLRNGRIAEIERHGDWVVMRDASGACVALDAPKGEDHGHWPVHADGRCHMSDLFLKGFFP